MPKVTLRTQALVLLFFACIFLFQKLENVNDFMVSYSNLLSSGSQSIDTSPSTGGSQFGCKPEQQRSSNKTDDGIFDGLPDQNKFTPPLTAECPYHDDVNGLFHPSVPHPRFIVTGGAGFIGSHLVKALSKIVGPHQVKVMDNLLRGRLANLQFDNGTWAINAAKDFCAIDLRNAKFIRGADYVYHLADIVAGVNFVFGHEEMVYRDNTLINVMTLNAVKKNRIPNYIYVGTACSFPQELQMGPGVHAIDVSLTYPAHPESAYGWSKLMGEYEAELAQKNGLNVGLLRFHNVYGPRSDYSARSGQAIPSLIRKALAYPQESFVVWGSGKQYRDFVHVDDVVDALLRLKDRGMNKGVIQIGSGVATTIAELARDVADVVGKRRGINITLEFDLCMPEGDRGRIAVTEPARTILGWEPKVSLRQGLEQTIDWISGTLKKKNVLVIMIGEARGSEYAWKSALHHMVKPLDAHLATFFTDKSNTTILQKNAQYVWEIPEPEDWGIYFDQAAAYCRPPERRHDWQTLCDIQNQWLGGTKACDHPASAGILLAFRWLVMQKILALNLHRHYDRFILTRADYVYFCDHADIRAMTEDVGHMPPGEGYGGYSDRHTVGATAAFTRMINITQALMCEPETWKQVLIPAHPNMNLETATARYFQHMNISIQEFPRSMFTVKLPADPTRWSKGYPTDIISNYDGLLVKYPVEFDLTKAHCKVDTDLKMQFIRNLTTEF